MKLKTLLLPLTASVLSGDYVKGQLHLMTLPVAVEVSVSL